MSTSVFEGVVGEGGTMLRWATALLSCGLAVSGVASEDWRGLSGAALLEDDAAGVPVVLTPARLRQPQSEVPASVTVIDRELIEASGAREVYELLRLVPGMDVVLSDGNIPQVSYHGTQAQDSRRMLVLVDGRSEYLPGLARVRWFDMPLTVEDVERIEVTRGPNSAAYGANAFVAVINIITRDPRDVSGASVSVTTSIRDSTLPGTGDWRVAGSLQGERWAARSMLSQHGDNGFDHPDSPRAGNDARLTTRFNSRFVFEPDHTQSIEVMVGASRGLLERHDVGIDPIAERQDDFVKENQRWHLQTRWKKFFSENHYLQVNAYALDNQRRLPLDLCGIEIVTGQQGPGSAIYFTREAREFFLADGGRRAFDNTMAAIGRAILGAPAGTPEEQAIHDRYAYLTDPGNGLEPFCYDMNYDVDEQSYAVELQDVLAVGDWLKLATGMSIKHDRGRSRTFASGSHDYTNRSLFGSLELAPVQFLRFSLGGYWENDDINGTFFSPRTALVVRPAPGHGVRLVHSRAVRTPDVYEQRAHFNFRAESLPQSFKPLESSMGWDKAEFFTNWQSPGTFKPERIRSRELGYFGRFRSLEWDIKYFEEELRDLISNALAIERFNTENDGEVDHRGWEGQLSWRPMPGQLLRVTAARIKTDTEKGREQRLLADYSGSVLWHMRLGEHWQLGNAYYLADSYRENRYEQLESRLSWIREFSANGVRVDLMSVVDLSGDPQVFDDARYNHRQHYRARVAVTF